LGEVRGEVGKMAIRPDSLVGTSNADGTSQMDGELWPDGDEQEEEVNADGDETGENTAGGGGRWRRLRPIIIVVSVLLAVDVAAVIWLQSWVGDRRAAKELEAKLPAWAQTVSNFQSCVLGEGLAGTDWGRVVLTRFVTERDYRKNLTESCYPEYQDGIAMVSPPGKAAGLSSKGRLDPLPAHQGGIEADAALAAKVCADVVGAVAWFRTQSQSAEEGNSFLNAQKCAATTGKLNRIQIPTVESPVTPVWGNLRSPQLLGTVRLQDGRLVANVRDLHNSSKRAIVRSRNGTDWDVLEYESVLDGGPQWREWITWGISGTSLLGENVSTILVHEGGLWKRRAGLPAGQQPVALGTTKSSLVIIVRRGADRGEVYSALFSRDVGRSFLDPVYLLSCSRVAGCVPQFHVGHDGTVTGVVVEQVAYSVSFQSYHLPRPNAQRQTQLIVLRQHQPKRNASIEVCGDGEFRWAMVNGATLLGSQDRGATWKTMHHYPGDSGFMGVSMACAKGWVAIAGPSMRQAVSGSAQYSVCGWSQTRCASPNILSTIPVDSIALRFNEDGLSMIVESIQRLSAIHYRDQRLTGMPQIVNVFHTIRSGPRRELPAWHLDGHWYLPKTFMDE
jgi:hypothetical protein